MVPEPKREEHNGIYMFLLLRSYAFLAPLSDPIFGFEMAPEPKREENHGIDMFFVLQFYTFLAPLSDPIFGAQNAPGNPTREENSPAQRARGVLRSPVTG